MSWRTLIRNFCSRFLDRYACESIGYTSFKQYCTRYRYRSRNSAKGSSATSVIKLVLYSAYHIVRSWPTNFWGTLRILFAMSSASSARSTPADARSTRADAMAGTSASSSRSTRADAMAGPRALESTGRTKKSAGVDWPGPRALESTGRDQEERWSRLAGTKSARVDWPGPRRALESTGRDQEERSSRLAGTKKSARLDWPGPRGLDYQNRSTPLTAATE